MAVDISQFIDIHVHILPGIDDGAKTLDESIALAEAYVYEGISQIIATPHFIPGTAWAADRVYIAGKIKELEENLQKRKIPLKIFPGMEIAYHQKLITRLEKDLLQSLADSGTYLLEPSFNDSAANLLQCAKQIMEKGFGVILAHPERIPAFQQTIEPLLDLTKQGLQIQLNVGSILNKFGEPSRRLAMSLFDKECVHYLASDAHSIEKRSPVTGVEWKVLSDLLGEELITSICVTNPNKLLR
jgi:protein-tyrosine phosphatase